MTYYDILGVPRTASFDDIRAAYRSQIRYFHPDVFPDNPDIAKIKTLQLNEAYGVLRDPVKRSEYDFQLFKQESASWEEAERTQSDDERRPQKKQRSPARRISFRAVLRLLFSVFVFLLIAVFIVGAVSTFLDSPSSDTPPEKPKGPSTAPFVTPSNGKILSSSVPADERIAPFTIDTTGDGYYYIKLRDVYTKQPVLTFFVHGGRSVEVDVPLGMYELLYAHGDTWYGVNNLFGPDTVYSKADDTFNFYEEDGYVNGWTVELYMQANGNLDVDSISPDEF